MDGGYIASGYTYSSDIAGLTNKGSDDAVIVKYDVDGNVVWQKSWGGNGGDEFYAAAPTSDGGYIASGYTYSSDIAGLVNNGSDDAMIVKYDANGNVVWQKSWGGNDSDYFYSATLTNDGGYIASGYTDSSDIAGLTNKGSGDAVIVKYDANGKMLWQKSWGGSEDDYFHSISPTNDSEYVVSGYTYSSDIAGLTNKGSGDAVIVKYDVDGNVVWQKSWGGNGNDEFFDVVPTNDGGYVASGGMQSTDIAGLTNRGNYDAAIVKFSEKITASVNYRYTSLDGPADAVLPSSNDGFIIGTDLAKPTTKMSGYTFDGWYLDKAMTIKANKTTMMEANAKNVDGQPDFTLYGKWVKAANPSTYDGVLSDIWVGVAIVALLGVVGLRPKRR